MDAFEKAINDQVDQDALRYAIDTLVKELSKDKSEGSYYYSWQANIAMAFQDEFNRYAEDKGIQATALSFNVHTISNKAAKNFLDLLCSKPEPPKQ